MVRLRSTSSYEFENRLLPNDYMVIRNQGEDQEMREEGMKDVEGHQGTARQAGDPTQVDFEYTSESQTSLP